jgi:hypothetical protein
MGRVPTLQGGATTPARASAATLIALLHLAASPGTGERRRTLARGGPKAERGEAPSQAKRPGRLTGACRFMGA